MKPALGAAVLAVGLFHGSTAQQSGSTAQQSRLDSPLQTTAHLIWVASDARIPPSDAGEMGLLSRLAAVAHAPFGFESDETAPRPAGSSSVEPRFVTAATLRQALDAFVDLDSRYRWKDLDGVFVVRTQSAWDDPANPLNRRVRNIHGRDLDPLAAFNLVAHLLYPADQRDYFQGIKRSTSRPFNVDLADGTILDVLNAAARDDGELGWWVSYGSGPSRADFALTLGHYGIGPTLRWRTRPEPR